MVVHYTQSDLLKIHSNKETSMTSSNLLVRKAVAAQILRHLARAQSRGQLVRLDELACDIGVRREDVRDVVASLHAEGHVDAQHMKLTMTGFAIAASMRECKLRNTRIENERPSQLHVA